MNWMDLLPMDDAHLARIDPAIQNLTVAKGLPSMERLDYRPYVRMLDAWADEVRRILPGKEEEFHFIPHEWNNDVDLFRAGVLAYYVDCVLGIRYKEDHRDVKKISYTDPNDLFLTGVLDTRRGTCGNLGVLIIALSWRLGWPLRLAAAKHHLFCRFDDGKKRFNLEVTNLGRGCFNAPADKYYIESQNLLPEWIACGSDLTALKPKQQLGVFFGLRARHYYDVQEGEGAKRDFQHAMQLFPQSRLYPHMLDQTILMENMFGSRSPKVIPVPGLPHGWSCDFGSVITVGMHTETKVKS